MELVGDNNYRLTVITHAAEDVEQLFGLLRSENRSRLVKDQDIRISVQNFYDLDGLLLRE